MPNNIKVIRKYSHSDSIMLTSISTIVENAILHKSIILPKRATWKDPFLSDFKTRIDTVIKEHFGVDSAKDLRNATKTVNTQQSEVLHKLALLHEEIVQDFKNTPTRRSEILTNLGFSEFYKPAYQNHSHSAFIDLLFRIKQNMTDDLKAEIVAKGTEEQSINDIIAFAETLKNSNVTQSGFKVNRPIITEETVENFNTLYSDAIALGRICSKIFFDDKAIKDSFSYTTISNLLKAPAPKDPPIAPTN